ncbi:hypothetical protein AVEN_274547-1, partial [Araneus ventricosus]
VLLNTRGTDVFNLELDKQKKHCSRGDSLSCPVKDYLLDIRGTDAPWELPLYTLKVIVSRTRNVLNIITCNLSSNDGHPLWGAPHRKESDHMMPGAIEPG